MRSQNPPRAEDCSVKTEEYNRGATCDSSAIVRSEGPSRPSGPIHAESIVLSLGASLGPSWPSVD